MQTILSNEKLDPSPMVPTVGLHNVGAVHIEDRNYSGVAVTVLVIRDDAGRELLNLDLFAAKALLGREAGKTLAIDFIEHQPAQDAA